MKGILLTHPDIVDADVIGIETGEKDSEAPRAYVVRRPGSEAMKLEAAAVKAYVEPKLASYRRLDGGVRFVESIAKNASGKVNTGVLLGIKETRECANVRTDPQKIAEETSEARDVASTQAVSSCNQTLC